MPDSPPIPSAGRPRWVKVFAFVAVLLVLLLAVELLAGGGHGPGRHLGAGHGPGRQAPPAGGQML